MPPKQVNGFAAAARPSHDNANAGPLFAHQAIECDIDAMLQKSQLGTFSGKGQDVGKQLKEWIEKMDDYFNLVQSTDENKGTMARFKL